MNGLSDPRLTLPHRELLEDGQTPPRVEFVHGGESRWALWRRCYATRGALLKLNAEQLKDIGLTHEQARAEALLPFWKR